MNRTGIKICDPQANIKSGPPTRRVVRHDVDNIIHPTDHDALVSVPAQLRRSRIAQGGSFLLEALISVLIVALGILGLIGLQARAFQNIDDAQYRAEAAYMANAYLGQMWVYDRTKLVADFVPLAAARPTPSSRRGWVNGSRARTLSEMPRR